MSSYDRRLTIPQNTIRFGQNDIWHRQHTALQTRTNSMHRRLQYCSCNDCKTLWCQQNHFKLADCMAAPHSPPVVRRPRGLLCTRRCQSEWSWRHSRVRDRRLVVLSTGALRGRDKQVPGPEVANWLDCVDWLRQPAQALVCNCMRACMCVVHELRALLLSGVRVPDECARMRVCVCVSVFMLHDQSNPGDKGTCAVATLRSTGELPRENCRQLKQQTVECLTLNRIKRGCFRLFLRVPSYSIDSPVSAWVQSVEYLRWAILLIM